MKKQHLRFCIVGLCFTFFSCQGELEKRATTILTQVAIEHELELINVETPEPYSEYDSIQFQISYLQEMALPDASCKSSEEWKTSPDSLNNAREIRAKMIDSLFEVVHQHQMTSDSMAKNGYWADVVFLNKGEVQLPYRVYFNQNMELINLLAYNQ